MSTGQKHIVLLTSEFPPLPGGIGNHAYNLAEYLSQEGYKVSVIADQRGKKEVELTFDSNLNSKVYRIAKTKQRFLMYIKRIWKTYKLVKSADILICSGKFPLWIGAFLKPFSFGKHIAIIHGSEVNFRKGSLRKSIDWSLKRFDKIIAVSNYTKSLVSHLKLKEITVIPNGYSISTTESSTYDFQLKGSPSLLTVGNLTKRKGQHNVIKHLPNLLEKYSDLHYHCVGIKTEIETCKTLAEQIAVSDNVTFWGKVSQQALFRAYENADICVMLSETTDTGDVEGFGIALIEANHFGTPTIGAKGCGIEDAINNENSGLLINKDSFEEFCNAIEDILKNYEHYKTQSKLWAQSHGWDKIINKYIAFMES